MTRDLQQLQSTLYKVLTDVGYEIKNRSSKEWQSSRVADG
jgi:hypothetical protein